jgi:hypothetical protein
MSAIRRKIEKPPTIQTPERMKSIDKATNAAIPISMSSKGYPRLESAKARQIIARLKAAKPSKAAL